MITVAAMLVAATFTRTLERVSTMDPAQATSIYDAHAVQLVYEPLLEVDYLARPYRLAPGFCELPEVSADGLRYVFRVRDGGRETGGAKLGAAEVVRTLERLRDPTSVTPNGWIVKDVDTIRALDAKTVEMRLKRRCHYFPWLMAMSACGVRGPNGEGSGSYVLSRWRKNHEMVFKRRSEVRSQTFDTIRYLVIDDPSTQWLMFLRGELDFLGEISRDNFDSIVGRDGRLDPALAAQGIGLHSIPTLEVMHLGINMRDSVLGPNRKLRQALNAAFDYPAWERYCNGRTLPCCGTPVPPGVDGRSERPFPYGFDLELARRLMSEAGYADGIDPKTGRRLVLTLSIGRANQESREAGELLAAFYAKVGIRLELDFKTWDAYLRAVNEGHVQLFRMGWVGDYPDAQNFLQLFYSKCVSPGPNHACYVNPEYDRAYEAALAAVSSEERNRHWMTCQEIICEDCPWVLTHVNKAYSLVRPSVKNYRPTDFPYGMEKYYEHALP